MKWLLLTLGCISCAALPEISDLDDMAGFGTGVLIVKGLFRNCKGHIIGHPEPYVYTVKIETCPESKHIFDERDFYVNEFEEGF